MAALTLRASGPAPADESWLRYLDVRRWPEWAPQIRAVEAPEGPVLHAGLTGRVRPVVGPAVSFEVTDVDIVRRTWAWTARYGPIRLRLRHAVLATPRGSRTTLRMSGPLPVLVSYAPIAQIALRRLVRP